MLKIKNITGIFLLSIFMLPTPASAEEETKACLNALHPLKVKKEIVGQMGGIWGLFEKTAGFEKESRVAIQLDSKINRLIWVSTHLCETLKGVPLNDLAIYLTQNLETKSHATFKNELLIQGWTSQEIDLWFRFADFATKNQTRTLQLKTVLDSVNRVETILENYKKLALALESHPNIGLLNDAKVLSKKIDDLQSGDTLLAQGLKEIQSIPRWDLDGSVGGS